MKKTLIILSLCLTTTLAHAQNLAAAISQSFAQAAYNIQQQRILNQKMLNLRPENLLRLQQRIDLREAAYQNKIASHYVSKHTPITLCAEGIYNHYLQFGNWQATLTEDELFILDQRAHESRLSAKTNPVYGLGNPGTPLDFPTNLR